LLRAALLDHRAALLRYFIARRVPAEEAEDILQDLAVKLASHASGPIADPLAYLYRVANNLMLDRRRAEMRSQRRDQDWHELGGSGALGVSETPSGERVLVAREQLAEAEAALKALGERTDFVFRRFRVDGQNQRDIADELGISLSAVEKHLQKAYRALIELRRRFDAG
jgi:RNA polymerase sigma-70 factor (ECF subfamily)